MFYNQKFNKATLKKFRVNVFGVHLKLQTKKKNVHFKAAYYSKLALPSHLKSSMGIQTREVLCHRVTQLSSAYHHQFLEGNLE